MANALLLIRRRLARFAAPSPLPNGDGHPDAGPVTERHVLERCAWSLVWTGVLIGGVTLWSSWTAFPAINALAPALVAVALIGFAICWSAASPRTWYHEGLALVAALVSIAVPQVANIHTRLYYSTDSAALDHVAAHALANGHNPYQLALAGRAGALLQTPAYYWTYLANGGHVGRVTYPAGSFLVYAPAFALGFRHLVVDWMDLYLWLAAAILFFFLVPRNLRWLAVLVSLLGIYSVLFAGGGTDAAFIPFAMLALWRWDRYGRGRGAGLAGWIGPIALGVACSIKQTPWVLVPFLLVGIAIETRRAGRSPLPVIGRYLGVVVAVFAAFNLPFIIMDASAWWHGVTLPFAKPLVADGQGLVALALHGLSGGANLDLLTVASALAYLAVLVALVAWYRPLKRLWPLLIAVPFFFSARSFSGYLLDFVPAALVGVVTVEAAAARRRHLRLGRLPVSYLLVGALAAGTGATAGVALTSAPLSLQYVSAHIGMDQQHVFAVTVAVTNDTDATQHPRFMVDIGAPHPSGFWTTPHDRPVVIPPHDTVGVTLFPPAQTLVYLPPWSADFVVQAYTTSPTALSTTAEIWHNYIPKQHVP